MAYLKSSDSKLQWNGIKVMASSIVGDLAKVRNESTVHEKQTMKEEAYPEETAILAKAPDVPPPITRNYPVKLLVNLEVIVKELPIDDSYTYEYWTFQESVPGPMIRARVGDIMQVKLVNRDQSGMMHNLDFHAVLGPGGGAPLLNCGKDETKVAQFRLTYPGLYIYHCAVDPVSVHISNGMFGLLLVEPDKGLQAVDKEYYLMQAEVYTEDNPITVDSRCLPQSIDKLMDERPNYVVFNGRQGSHLENNPFKAKVGDRVRFYVGNAGPALDGSLLNQPQLGLQTVMIPSGSSAVVELDAVVPGNFTLVDHSITRIEKGCVAFLQVVGETKDPYLYCSEEGPSPCPGCKIHP
ncbi:Copper-containing nitrite reductase [Galdieria sulphuraria]|nr:Copper-containing nitrite reductase [Galdieria sulphuraria]